MKKLILMLFIIIASTQLEAQTSAKLTPNGSYLLVDKATSLDPKDLTPSGKSATNKKGESFPIYVSKNNKYFILKTSKAGKQYKQYIKLE